jgi:hypothetical protein
MSIHGGAVYMTPTPYLPPSSAHSTDALSQPPTRRHLLIRRPTPQSSDEIDIKPYSSLIPRPTSRVSTASAQSPSSSSRSSDSLAAFGRFRSERLSDKELASLVSSSDLRNHDQTARILGILKVREQKEMPGKDSHSQGFPWQPCYHMFPLCNCHRHLVLTSLLLFELQNPLTPIHNPVLQPIHNPVLVET